MATQEDEIRTQGAEIFRLMEAGVPAVFDRRRWAGMLMNLAMSDPEAKVRLFRFVDILPALTTSEQITAHLREYFLDEATRFITGAVVGRQPFGGFRMSGVGSKAGGPDYLLRFLEPHVVTENTMRRGFAPDVFS